MKGFLRMNTGFQVRIAILATLRIGLSSSTPGFLSLANASSMIENVGLIGLVGTGIMLTMIVGHLDLAVASVADVAAILALSLAGDSLPLGIVVALAMAGLYGAVIGYVIDRTGVNSLVLTVCMLIALRGLALVMTPDRPAILPFEMFWVSDGLVAQWGPLTLMGIICLVGIGCVGLALRHTKLDLSMYAVGGNPERARGSGISTTRAYMAAFAGSAMLGAVAGILAALRSGSVSRASCLPVSPWRWSRHRRAPGEGGLVASAGGSRAFDPQRGRLDGGRFRTARPRRCRRYHRSGHLWRDRCRGGRSRRAAQAARPGRRRPVGGRGDRDAGNRRMGPRLQRQSARQHAFEDKFHIGAQSRRRRGDRHRVELVGKSGQGFFGAYCASKAGLTSQTHTAADELAKDKIRVNTVAPGNVATSMHLDALTEEAQKRDISFEAMKKIEWDNIPLGRAADPSEIADAINFLAGPDRKYITGATIDVNGGCLFS